MGTKVRREKKEKVWKPKQATVTWLDACLQKDLFGPVDEVLKHAQLAVRESVGYLLRYDEKLLVLATDYDAPDAPDDKPEVGVITTIPSGWVLKAKIGGRLITREEWNRERPKGGPETDTRFSQHPEHPREQRRGDSDPVSILPEGGTPVLQPKGAGVLLPEVRTERTTPETSSGHPAGDSGRGGQQ